MSTPPAASEAASATAALSSPESETIVKFAVEALARHGRWELWGVSEGDKILNPCDTLEEAKTLKGDLDDFRSTEKTGYTDSRISEVKVTRTVVVPASGK